MGLLPQVASDLSVSVPTAGNLVTAYAVGVVVGAPLLTAAGSRRSRRTLLLAFMGLFAMGNGLAALAPGLRHTARGPVRHRAAARRVLRRGRARRRRSGRPGAAGVGGRVAVPRAHRREPGRCARGDRVRRRRRLAAGVRADRGGGAAVCRRDAASPCRATSPARRRAGRAARRAGGLPPARGAAGSRDGRVRLRRPLHVLDLHRADDHRGHGLVAGRGADHAGPAGSRHDRRDVPGRPARRPHGQPAGGRRRARRAVGRCSSAAVAAVHSRGAARRWPRSRSAH